MTVESLPAPYRRHQHLVAPAGAAVDFLAGAELQVLAEADPDLAESLGVAGHRNRRRAHAGIGLDESRLEVVGGDRFRLRQLQEFLGDFPRRAGFPDGFEIGALAEA